MTEVSDKEVGMTEEEKLAIFDQLLFEGFYSETIILTPKTSLSLKTRSGDETIQIGRDLEDLKPNTEFLAAVFLPLLHLSYAVLSFSGKDMSSIKPYPEKFNFLKKLPGHIIDRLQSELSKLDKKVSEATEFSKDGF